MTEAPIRPLVLLTALAAACIAVVPAGAQRIDWRSRATFYGDNTEFFTPYRVGETILGTQLQGWFEAAPSRRTELRLGLFADRRLGSARFTDTLLPIASLRYRTAHSLGVIGTLETERRHGLLEPLMVTTRELTAPVESGLQWIETRGRIRGEAWINWQRLNTPTQREQFEMGTTLALDAGEGITLEGQHLRSHRGGQLFDAGVPVTNNSAIAVGARVARTLPVAGVTSLAAWRLWSRGVLDPEAPSERPTRGHGTYLRASIAPRGWVEAFMIHWEGRDYVAAAGDNNYNSTGADPDFYRSHRRYTEVGVMRRTGDGDGVRFDAELRLHRIDHERSVALFFSSWELSYRVIARVPLDVAVRR